MATKKKTARGGTATKKAPASRKKGRQRDGQPSDSQKVREWIAADKKERAALKPAALMEALKADGITVSKSTATQVMYTEFRRKRRKPYSINRKTAKRKGTSEISVSDLIAVKKLADDFGGIQRLREAADALDQLSGS